MTGAPAPHSQRNDQEELWLDAVEFLEDHGLQQGQQELEDTAREVWGVAPDALPPNGVMKAAQATPLRGAARARLLQRVAPLKGQAAYVLGGTGLWVCAYWLGRSPSTFHWLYTALACILLGVRYVTYRRRKWHYYVLDLCYYCNALLFVHVWLAPRCGALAVATFAFNAGPVTTSILAFRNAFVAHDLERVTSLFLHLMPACVSWAVKGSAQHPHTQRWFGDAYTQPVSRASLIAIPLLYGLWVTIYSGVIFLVAADRIQRRGYVTLFRYCTTRRRGTFAAITARVPARARPAVYLALHLCFCAVSLTLSAVSWRWRGAHTALLAGAGTMALWHGAAHAIPAWQQPHAVPRTAARPLTPAGPHSD